MDQLQCEFGPFADRRALSEAVLVGVVGSGNLEALFESATLDGCIRFDVSTSIGGFEATWRAVLDDFAARLQRGDLRVSINDGGATPAVVGLRLRQAAAALEAAA